MTPPESPTLWLPPFSLVVLALLIGLISFACPLIPFSLTGQAFLLIAVLRAFCGWPPMVRWVASMPVPHRAVFALMIGSMILGHYTLTARTYFPCVAWEIFPFVDERDPVTCREFIATTAGGRQVRLLAEQLFPSIVQVYPLDDPKHFSPTTLEHLARALAKVYNEHHADDPVRRVDLVAMAVKLHPPADESRSQPSCELLKRYDISSGR